MTTTKREGVSCPGSQHPSASLTPKQVVALRKEWAAGEYTKVSIAESYGLSYGAALRCFQRKSYKDVA